MTTLLKQSTNRGVMVLLIDETDDETGFEGLTAGDMTITASKNAGSFASISPTVTDQGDGNYALSLTNAHTDTLGDFVLHIEAAGINKYDEKFQVVVALPGESIASVTGSVGSVTGSVGSVAGAVGSVTGDVGGNVVGNVNGTVKLSDVGLAAVHNWAAGVESYAADGAVPTPFQIGLMILQAIGHASKNPTTGVITLYKLDGVTPWSTFVPDVAPPATPTSYTRAT